MTGLERYFHQYNDKYFNGELPEPVIRWADLKHFGHYYQEDGQHIIELAEWMRKNNTLWRSTLLHELVHLKLRNRKCKVHGRVFHNEMKRLANLDAFKDLW
jgi:hypothetical protein